MGLMKVLMVVIASAISTSAFTHLCPHTKELVYRWHALVKAGTDLPTPHASQFALDGKLHLQATPNATHVKITDLTYKLYNGILDHVHEHQAHSVPVQIPQLHHVFKVVYDNKGLAVGISTENSDQEFSRNIKKAIATMLQMDDSVLKPVHHQHPHPHCFVLKEHSIYGKFDVDYTVRHHQNGDVEVEKMHDMRDYHHLYQNLVSNNEDCPCDVKPESPLSHVSRKQYVITTREGEKVVKTIKATGILTYQPFGGQSEHQFVFVNQTLELDTVVSVSERLQVQSEHFEDHLTYHYFTDSEDGRIHDVTNGRHVADYDKLIPSLQHMLEDTYQYAHEDHIHTREPDTKRGQLINRVQRLLQTLTLTKLRELHKTLTGHSLRVFHAMLPLVGTKASTLFIKHLIVNKIVTDDTAVEMLQHLPEHIVEPTVELLTQLEELIHLDETIPWNIRKACLLAFATLIHKSHVFVERIHRNLEYDHHIPHTDTFNHQQPYEKYVVEYINKIRSSQDHKVRIAYTFALCNMRLHSIVQHMAPAVSGDWFGDYHFRVMSLWSVGSVAIVDPNPNTVIEALWPVFIDTNEITEMRAIAFYLLMQSKLSHSMVMNLYEHLLEERNEEMYRLVYTYLENVMTANNPCYQEMKIHASHLIQLLPPPSHGNSFSKIYDYKDVRFGYGTGMEEYFVSGNHALIYALKMTSQQYNIQHEDYDVYFKVHGIQNHGEPMDMVLEVLRKKTKSFSGNKDINIECVIFRHGHAINTYFFNHDNLHELDELLDFFTKDSKSVTRTLAHLSYNEYLKAVIPTDLGIPVVWEYLMPALHHNNITITKETVNKVINIHLDYKYINWMHFRHGLTFYNPIADVWQGINRYQSFDAVLPIHLDVTINTQQQSLQLSWKKHSNLQQNVAGFRTHVKQMVFVKDDYNRNIMLQSSPQCKDFVIVTHGKQFRHEYIFQQDDDLTTGHQWYLTFYDSSRYVSNGTFHHVLDLMSQSHPHHTESPLIHFLKSCANFHQHIILLPKPGVYGFMGRLEPSHHHAVSNIDLSLRLHSEPTTEDSHYYTPKTKWSTRATYSVKNQEKSLKTWDINTIVDMNPGHTINNLKMHITRIVPGQKDYKICVDGVKKWTQKGVEGHLNVGMSQTSDGKCVKDDTVIDVTMTGRQSQEQLEGHHKYASCEHISPYSLQHKHSLQCLAGHTTARHYVYNVKTTNVPTEFRKWFVHLWDTIKGYYMPYYVFEDEHNENIGDHNLRVDVVYPMQEQEMNIRMTSPQHVYKLIGVPTHYWKWCGLSPDSMEYSDGFQLAHDLGFVDHCQVELTHYHANHHQVQEPVPTEWTLYVGNVAQNPQKAVYVKRVANDELAVKIVDHGHIVEIVPHGANHQITLDGQVVPITEYHHEDWVFCHVFTQDSHQPVAVMLPNSGIHVEYHHHQVVAVVPKVDQQLHGRCYSH